MNKLLGKLLALVALVLSICWFVYIWTQQWFMTITQLYLTERMDNTWYMSVDVSNFMRGMWLMVMLCLIIGFYTGFVFGKTSHDKR